jgi:mRNA interferase MazF
MMPSMTACSFGDVILVPFPFTDQSQSKQRPAVVVSSARYNTERPDLVLMAITSQVRSPPAFGESSVLDWQAAGLIKLSVIKPVLATLDQRLVRKTLGRLSETDRSALKDTLRLILG